MKRLIAISGGIGCGKSVVAAILRRLSYPVYDCDSRAKALMDGDSEILGRLSSEIHADVVVDGVIDRSRLSEIVFSDSSKLAILNSIVHGAVKSDLQRWVEAHDERLLFVETAILYQSGLDRVVDEVWEVTAPLEVRIERVMKRNGCPASDVEARISSQSISDGGVGHRRVFEIANDGFVPLLPQIESLLINHTN